ncbi:phage tail tape measure protein [Streptomyces beijiangensis]|uniref:Phage tail tape measure protein n=1 Tax=Streptomyces beijiangensis TaxID=163361 RepID=A0A939FD05_9ACTN|nr:phage tail tape measure protein [Streptomyces beijiangensis]MBO0514785.1 phage tail tape measure protein [Streptomyces beijiangensis]
MASGYNLYVNLMATTNGLSSGLRRGANDLRAFDGQLDSTSGRLNQVRVASQQLARAQAAASAGTVRSNAQVAASTQRVTTAQQTAARAQGVQASAAQRAASAQAAVTAAGERAARAQVVSQTMAARAAAATGSSAAAAGRTAAAAQVAATRATDEHAAAQRRAASAQAGAARAAALVASAETRAQSASRMRDETQASAARNAQVQARQIASAEAGLVAARTAQAQRSAQTGLLIGAALGVGVAKAIELERHMANVMTISKEIGTENVQQYTDAIVEMSTRLPQTASQLAVGLYQIVSTGFDGAQAMSILDVAAKGASAGLTTTETSARALLGVLKAYGMPASQASDVMDTMFQTVNLGVVSFEELAQQLGDVVPMASAAGVEFDDLSSAFAAVTLAGIPAAETATALNMLLTRMMKPTAELRNVIHDLGYESASSALKQDGLYVVMEKIRAKTGGTAAAVVPLLKDIRAVRAALALGAADGANYASTMSAIDIETNRAQATQKAYAIQMDTTAGQWQMFRNQATAVGIDLGRAMLPALKSIGEAMKVFASVANDAPGGLKTTAAWLIALGAAALIARAGLAKVTTQWAAFRTAMAARAAGGAAMPVALSGMGLAVSGLTALLAIGTIAYAAYAASKQKAKDVTEELVTALQSERGEDGVAGAGVRKLAEQLVTSGDLEKLKKAGVDVNTAVDAITQGGKKLDDLKDKLRWDNATIDPLTGDLAADPNDNKLLNLLDDRRKWWSEASKTDAEITTAMNAMSAKIRDAESNYGGAWALDKLLTTDSKGQPQYSDEMKALAKAVDDAVDPSRALKDAQQGVADSLRKAGKNADDAKASLAGYMEQMRKQSQAQGAFQGNLAKLALADGGDYQTLVDHFADLGMDGSGVLDELVKQLGKGNTKNADELLKIVGLDSERAQATYREGLARLPEIASRYGKETADAWAKASATNDPSQFEKIMKSMALTDLGKAVKQQTADARVSLAQGMDLVAKTARKGGKQAADNFRSALLKGDRKGAEDALTAVWGLDKPISAPDLSNVVGAFATAGKQADQQWSGMLDLIVQAASLKGPAAASALTSALLSGDMQAVKNLLDAIGLSVSTIPDTKQVTVNVTANQPAPVVVPIYFKRQASSWDQDANGVPDSVQAPQSRGSVIDFYANGGVRKEQHVAQIAPAGAWRVWAEEETGGEAYIPLAHSKRGRSRAIAEETVRRLGGKGVQWYANGGLDGFDYQHPELYTLSGIAGDSKDKKDRFSLSKFAKNLDKSVAVARRWRRDLDTVARRAGQDVADALAAMGEDGIDLTHKMATGSAKNVKAMTKDLQALTAASKASLGSYTSQLKAAVKDQTAFEKNLAKLVASGYGDLAKMLAGQADGDAEDLAAEAVKSRSKAKAANSAAKSANKTVPDSDLPDLVAIIAAVKNSKTGLHAVSEATQLDEDHIIEIANLAYSRIKAALGSKGSTFLSDLGKANKGLAYADGGIRAGLYATSNGIIRFAEPETEGEAYVPLGAAKRGSATAVLKDVASRFGYQLTANGVSGPTHLVDARPAGVQVVVVREQPAALVGSMPVTVHGTADRSAADAVGSEIMRRLRNAQRGGRV